MNPAPQYPTVLRRLMCMVYEALLLIAVLAIADFTFVYATNYPQRPALRPMLQIYLLFVTACYFTWFWSKGGQTLAMKTWRLRVENVSGQLLSVPQALRRFALALIGFAACLITIAWALFDHDKLFLHDRLLGSRIVLLDVKK